MPHVSNVEGEHQINLGEIFRAELLGPMTCHVQTMGAKDRSCPMIGAIALVPIASSGGDDADLISQAGLGDGGPHHHLSHG